MSNMINEMNDLKRCLEDHIQRQEKKNCELDERIDQILSCKTLQPHMLKCFKLLNDKQKDQDAKLNQLMGNQVGGTAEELVRNGSTVEEEDDESDSSEIMNQHQDDTTVDKAIQTEEVTTSATNFSLYSDVLKQRIGKRVPEWPKIGPIMSLDSDGCCIFDPKSDFNSEQYLEMWRSIISGTTGCIHSKYILLPDVWDGLIVQIALCYKTSRVFQVRLFVEDILYNRPVTLPCEIDLQVILTIPDDDDYESKVHRFVIRKLFAKPITDDLLVPICVDGETFPEIKLKFSTTMT